MNFTELLTFPVPLNGAMRQKAEKLSQQKSTLVKQKQNYLNLLAVLAMDFYCQCMEIETDLDSSDCFNSITRHLMDVADLKLKNLGTIECRPILPGDNYCYIPAEVWEDRLGYLVVMIDEDENKATLLGFLEQVKTELLPLSKLRSLEEFLIKIKENKENLVINLSQWWDENFGDVWIPLIYKPVLRGARSKSTVKAKKEIDYELLLNRQPIDLVITMEPENNEEMGVLVQIKPREKDNKIYLPKGLKLRVTLESDVAEVEARSKDKIIQLEFSENVGKSFSVEVILDDAVVTENFII
jgi:hypothetical protein